MKVQSANMQNYLILGLFDIMALLNLKKMNCSDDE